MALVILIVYLSECVVDYIKVPSSFVFRHTFLCFAVLHADEGKHAFISKFNGLPPELYTRFRNELAHQVRSQNQAHNQSHSEKRNVEEAQIEKLLDFIPLPITCLVIFFVVVCFTASLCVH
jgi:hypothetical protein